MIQDLSQTLRTVLTKAEGLNSPLKNAQIVFDRPSDPFAPTPPAVDLFLYDVRENLELRNNEPIITRNNGQASITPPPLRLACSYLVTAWPAGTGELAVLQEHQLLGQVLQVLSRFPRIPAEFLQGSLKGQDPPLPMVALHPDVLKNISEFWTSLGNKLRPSLTVTATISLPVFADVTAPIVTTHFTGFEVGAGAVPETLVQIGGRVLDARGQGVAGALVDILDSGLRTHTGTDGHFSFVRVPTGAHTIRAVAVGFQPKTQPLVVPGLPGDYEITLAPL